jgi:hypothetical protein
MSHAWSWTRGVQTFGIAAIAGAVALAGCGGGGGNGSGGGDTPEAGTVDGSPLGGGDAGDAGNLIGNAPQLKAITITPLQAAITSTNGSTVKQAFTVQAQYTNGTTSALSSGSGISWTIDSPLVGSIDNSGNFTASGSLGGVVHVSATYKSLTATANLTVKLLLQSNAANVPPGVQSGLQGATAADPTVVWAYPYDGTVWPRGLDSPLLMWNGGAATDAYYVHISDPTFEYQGFFTAPPPAQLSIPAAAWQTFVDSTSGPATFTVARFDGTSDTVITKQTWTIAPASMRGTVYYWANNLGRIMRLTPGSTPDDFSVGVVPAPTSQCTMACHTVAANGSAMIAAGGTFGGTYNLQNNTMGHGVGTGENSGPIRQWGLSALSPTAEYVEVDALMDALTGLTPDGTYNASNGAAVSPSGLSGEKTFMPAFSPDGSSLVYVSGMLPGTAYWLATGAAGATAPTDPSWGLLKAYDFNASGSPLFSNGRTIMTPGSDPSNDVIAWPTVTPDGRWAIYARLGWVDPSTQHNLSSYPPVVSDLYMADLKNPGTEIRLGNLDGDNYPFAAGARDLHLNFEPSAAPVASGGYFWVVMHSRRTYGNVLTGDRTTEKQLWIAAIDQNPQPGKDPSHPAFWLPGQSTATLNLRGYFALPPCAQDGQGCQSGTDCCGGYCAPSGDGGAPACRSMPMGCSQDGDKCNTASDCCNSGAGEQCIAHVCSEPTPQ